MIEATLKTPEQWAEEEGIRIWDPDGWRPPHEKNFYEPITREEYEWRVAESTIQRLR